MEIFPSAEGPLYRIFESCQNGEHFTKLFIASSWRQWYWFLWQKIKQRIRRTLFLTIISPNHIPDIAKNIIREFMLSFNFHANSILLFEAHELKKVSRRSQRLTFSPLAVLNWTLRRNTRGKASNLTGYSSRNNIICNKDENRAKFLRHLPKFREGFFIWNFEEWVVWGNFTKLSITGSWQ